MIRRIVLKDGSLRTQAGSQSIELKPLSETRFRPSGQEVELRFEPAGATGMRLLSVPDNGAKTTIYERGEEFKSTEGQLRDFAGQYQSDEIEPVYRINIRDRKLVLERLKSEPAQIEPAITDLFTSSAGNIRFTRNSQGKVIGFGLSNGRILNFRFRKI